MCLVEGGAHLVERVEGPGVDDDGEGQGDGRVGAEPGRLVGTGHVEQAVGGVEREGVEGVEGEGGLWHNEVLLPGGQRRGRACVRAKKEGVTR